MGRGRAAHLLTSRRRRRAPLLSEWNHACKPGRLPLARGMRRALQVGRRPPGRNGLKRANGHGMASVGHRVARGRAQPSGAHP